MKHLSEISHFQWFPAVCRSPKLENGYSAKNGEYLLASEDVQLLKALRPKGQKSQDGNVWIGYVAYSEAEKDILVVWRGTQRPFEWVKDAE
jgi:hypothetical protein